MAKPAVTEQSTSDSDSLPLLGPRTAPDHQGLETHGLQARLEARLFDAPVTSRIGGYVVVEVLGEGAMGTVYLAYDPELDRRVAVKVLRHVRVHDAAKASARMEREAKAMAKLAHPNVVAVHEVGRADGQIFVAMEYVEGGTLAQWCRANPPGQTGRLDALLDLADGAARGLAAAHRAGLVHRDFKPANALVGSDGRLRVADFGLARPRNDTDTAPSEASGDDLDRDARLTATGELVGTPAYMAPEQFRGVCNERSDQFGWCAAFYEAAFGVRPFAGDTLMQVLDSIEAGALTKPRSDTRVPGWLRRLLERGLSREPAERWPSMDAIVAEIARRRRSRWPLFFGGAALVAVGVGGTLALQPAAADDTAVCTDPRPQLEEAWGVAKQDAVRAAILGSGAAYADDTWERLSRELTAAADAWTEASLKTCRASSSDEPEEVARAERRAGCLRRVRELFVFTTDELSAADRDLVRASSRTVAGLREQMSCDDDTLAADEGDVVDATLAALGQADVLRRMKRLSEANEVLTRAQAALEGHQLPSLQARLHDRLASVAFDRDDQEAFDAHATRFLDHAERSGEPELRADAWLDASIAARRARDFDAAAFRIGRAENLTADGTGGRRMSVAIWRSRAALASWQQRDAEALAHYEHAEAILREEAPGTIQHAVVLRAMASASFAGGDSDRAMTLGNRALDIFVERLGPDHPETAVERLTLANLGVRLGAAETAALIDDAERVLLANPEYQPSRLGSVHEIRGLLMLGSGDQGAVEELAQAEAIYARTLGADHTAVFHVRLFRANALQSRGDLPEAAELYRALVEQFGDVEGLAETLAIARMNLADAEAALGNAEAALTQISAARKVLDTTYQTRSTVWRSTFLNVARVYRLAERLDLAEELLDEIEASIDASESAVPTNDRVWLGIERARMLEAKGDRKAAFEAAKNARKIATAETVSKPVLLADLAAVETMLAQDAK